MKKLFLLLLVSFTMLFGACQHTATHKVTKLHSYKVHSTVVDSIPDNDWIYYYVAMTNNNGYYYYTSPTPITNFDNLTYTYSSSDPVSTFSPTDVTTMSDNSVSTQAIETSIESSSGQNVSFESVDVSDATGVEVESSAGTVESFDSSPDAGDNSGSDAGSSDAGSSDGGGGGDGGGGDGGGGGE